MQLAVKITILFAILFSFGCSKENPDPAPPSITFMDAQFSADKSFSIVQFEFFDGDGDLGLKQDENGGELEFNVFVDYYEKINGVWILKSPVITYNTTEAKFDTTDLHLRLPFLENESGRSLEGETKIDLLYDFNADTFRYEISIKDRALQLSNVITTSELITN
jgi:hypothetical protein